MRNPRGVPFDGLPGRERHRGRLRFPNASDDPRNHDNNLSAAEGKNLKSKNVSSDSDDEEQEKKQGEDEEQTGSLKHQFNTMENVMKGKVKYMTDGMESAKDMKRFEMQEDFCISLIHNRKW